MKHLDHVVCTHPHDDHAAGLVGVLDSQALTIGRFWMHLPWTHLDYAQLTASLSKADQTKVVRIIRASLDTAQELYSVAKGQGIQISEPFDTASIGPLSVCGPTVQFYRKLLLEFGDFEKLQGFETARAEHELNLMVEEFASGTMVLGRPLAEDDGELGNEPTEPENDASTIITAVHNDRQILLTADAGVPALQSAISRHGLNNLNWMQIPHHGSRRNLTQELVEHFKPTSAFVSAAGSRQHPRRKVVNAFKSVGTMVYSTHYPNPGPLRHSLGVVPEWSGYSAATAL